MRSPRYVMAVLVAAITLSLAAVSFGQTKRPITFDDLIKLKRVGDVQLSPDGKTIAYVVREYNKASNSSNADIWLVPVAGGAPRQLTASPRSDTSPRWSPNGRKLAFISNRDGESQVWVIDVAGGEARKVTQISTGASGVIWSPDGKWLAFVSDVYPECTDDACNKQKAEQVSQSKVKAKVIDRLLYRHWSDWKDGKRSHLFLVPAEGGPARDLTPGDYDVPPFSLGGPTDYAFAPDSKEIAFVRNTDKVEAISTNSDVFVVSVTGGEPKRITTGKGADNAPLYSGDGRYLAYRSQERAGFEADRWRLFIYDRQTGAQRELTTGFDRPVDSMIWTPDNRRLIFTAEDRGLAPIFSVSLAGGDVKPVLGNGYYSEVSIAPDGKTLVFTRQSMTQPAEVYRAQVDGQGLTRLTNNNDALLATLEMVEPDSIEYTGADNTKVHGWVIKPPRFDRAKKYPMILLIHGGPQGAWSNNFGYRWNPQMFAAPGYVVVMLNPRGSTGYGQKFTDEISGDWAGKVYEDLMKGVDYVVNLGYVDKDHIGAAGGSYGGYMVNWIAGHNDDKRFKTLVSHAGVYNLTSMYGVTEELWFPEWEFKGVPWNNPELYEKWSPHLHARNFKTPVLVTHGELDYRVPIGEGLQLFTALQRQEVPSKLLYFPDEGHWILKPQNSELWYKTVLDWFDVYLR